MRVKTKDPLLKLLAGDPPEITAAFILRKGVETVAREELLKYATEAWLERHPELKDMIERKVGETIDRCVKPPFIPKDIEVCLRGRTPELRRQVLEEVRRRLP